MLKTDESILLARSDLPSFLRTELEGFLTFLWGKTKQNKVRKNQGKNNQSMEIMSISKMEGKQIRRRYTVLSWFANANALDGVAQIYSKVKHLGAIASLSIKLI